MIKELVWDTHLFKRKMGQLKVSSQPFSQITTALQEARAEGFSYLICKLKFQDTGLIRFLEASGFYLSDIAIIWSIQCKEFPFSKTAVSAFTENALTVATSKDIPMLREMAKSLFLESRFYHDPFFSHEEADSFYEAWVENSVKGEVADIVYCIPHKGFIVCKKSGDTSGDIVLIGTNEEFRGRGIATALVKEAVRWFDMHGLRSICVKTQLRNVHAMNFYRSLGFTIKEYELLLAKIL